MTGDNVLFWLLSLSGENKLKQQNKNLVPVPLGSLYDPSLVKALPFLSLTSLWFALRTAYALFKLISIARYAFKSPSICFQGLHMKFSTNVLLAYILYCDARPNCLITTDIIFSYIWYILQCIVKKNKQITKKKNIFVLVRFFFGSAITLLPESLFRDFFILHASSLCRLSLMCRFFRPLSILAPHDSNIAV